jgi:hypothetical protein
MAVAVFIRYAGVGLREYDRLMANFGFDASPPIGEILHIAAEGSGYVDVCEVWQTAEAAETFVEERLRPALAAQGAVAELDVHIAPLHNLFAADMATIERIGAVSLPRHVASAVLS